MKTPFVICDGVSYVQLDAIGIGSLIACIDGLIMTFFKPSKKAYIRLDVAIEWYEKELLAEVWGKRATEQRTKVLASLKRHREKFEVEIQHNKRKECHVRE